MGFQTNISILNDHFDWIRKNPETFVYAIFLAMNDGTESLVSQLHNKRRAAEKGEEYYDPHWPNYDEVRQARSRYVTVHPTAHADIDQVIVTGGNSAHQVWDLTRGIQMGWLDQYEGETRERMVKYYRDIAKELRRQAKGLDDAIKEVEAKISAEV